MDESIKVYLPKFLSEDSEKKLFDGLKQFPNNLDNRIYTKYLESSKLIHQGDGLKDLLVINLPSTTIKPVTSIILSNTCDIDPSNERIFPSNILYAPILKLSSYEELLKSKTKKSKQQINSHINSIRKQEVNQIFYLPVLAGKLEESIVFLDRVCNIESKYIERSKLKDQRIFTLSDYGAYLFLIKISIHFTRIQDKIERKSMNSMCSG